MLALWILFIPNCACINLSLAAIFQLETSADGNRILCQHLIMKLEKFGKCLYCVARWGTLSRLDGIPLICESQQTCEQIDLFSRNILSSLLAMHINLMGGFPGDWVIKYLSAIAEAAWDVRSIPGLGISHGGGNGNPLWYYCLESSMDTEAWQATVHGSQRVIGCNELSIIFQSRVHFQNV